jgi:hypothetical protein
MSGPKERDDQDREELERKQERLEREKLALQKEVERLRAERERLKGEIERLKRELQAALRRGHRRAAPYSKDRRAANPKRPGRRAGQGRWNRRQAPGESDLRRPVVQVPVTDPCCPDCGGALEWEATQEASVTDLRPLPEPEVTVYQIEVRRCARCGRRVRGQHPDVAPDQLGATAHRVGPGVKAAAHALHYGVGVPVRQVPKVLQELTGVRITQGALTQDALKRSRAEVGVAYEQLRASVRQAPTVYTDDTGWRLGGKPAHLMVFDTDRATVYQIRPQHRNEEVRELVPSSYRGTLVADRGKSYDAEELSAVPQQKCLSHLLRNVAEVVESKSGPARTFGLRLDGLLHEAIDLGKQRHTPTFELRVTELDEKLTRHLRDRTLKDADNQQLLDGIGFQHDNDRLLRFLHQPGVEPTNNRSERMLRPAVIARKVSQCSKNDDGANAFAAFVSVARTAIKNGSSSLTGFLHRLFTSSPELPP